MHLSWVVSCRSCSSSACSACAPAAALESASVWHAASAVAGHRGSVGSLLGCPEAASSLPRLPAPSCSTGKYFVIVLRWCAGSPFAWDIGVVLPIPCKSTPSVKPAAFARWGSFQQADHLYKAVAHCRGLFQCRGVGEALPSECLGLLQMPGLLRLLFHAEVAVRSCLAHPCW